MSAVAFREVLVTPEEYLAAEESAVERHEYLNGMVHAMSGGSVEHAAIGGSVFALLREQLRGKPCRPLGSDMKLRAFRDRVRRFYYPDAMVVCHPRPGSVWQDAPVVLVEVLSPSTRRIDLVEKRDVYFAIPTLRHYVIFDSAVVDAVAWSRAAGDSEWEMESRQGAGAVVELPAIGCKLPLTEVYEDTGLR